MPIDPDWLLSFVIFGFSTAGTPGPNNLMLAASGATFGLRRTAAHITGIALGFPAMIAAVGLGLGEIFQRAPLIQEALKWAGSAYLLFLAWKIATAAGPDPARNGAEGRGRPLTFLQAAAFQWVNPKAWTMVMAMLGVYAGHNGAYLADVVIMSVTFVGIAFVTATAWAAIGVGAGRLLTPARLVWFNRFMAALMLASLVLVWT
jgi:threonine/homoserine/homoserine lactone efflux protein